MSYCNSDIVKDSLKLRRIARLKFVMRGTFETEKLIAFLIFTGSFIKKKSNWQGRFYK
jgi:hypothetical protein